MGTALTWDTPPTEEELAKVDKPALTWDTPPTEEELGAVKEPFTKHMFEPTSFIERLTSPVETLLAEPTVSESVTAKKQELRRTTEDNRDYKTEALEPLDTIDSFFKNKKYTAKSLQGRVRYLREDEGLSHKEALDKIKAEGATPLDMADAVRYMSGTVVSDAVNENVYQPIKDATTQIGAGLMRVTLDTLDFFGVDTTDEQVNLDYAVADNAIRDEDYRDKYGIPSPAKLAMQGFTLATANALTSTNQAITGISALSKTALTEGITEYVLGRGVGHDKATAAAQAVIVGTSLGIANGLSARLANKTKTLQLPTMSEEAINKNPAKWRAMQDKWVADFSIKKDIAPEYHKEFEALELLGIKERDIATMLLKMQKTTDGGTQLSFEEAMADIVASYDTRTSGYLFEAINNNAVVQQKMLEAISKRSKDMEALVPKEMSKIWKKHRFKAKGGTQSTNWMTLLDDMENKGLDVEYADFYNQVKEYSGTIADSDMTMFRVIQTPIGIDAPSQLHFTGGAKTGPLAQTQAQATQTLQHFLPMGRMLNSLANYLNKKTMGKLADLDTSIATMVEKGLLNDRVKAKDLVSIIKRDHPNLTPQEIKEASEAMEKAAKESLRQAEDDITGTKRAQEAIDKYNVGIDDRDWENYNQYIREKRATQAKQAEEAEEKQRLLGVKEADAEAKMALKDAEEEAKLSKQAEDAKAEATYKRIKDEAATLKTVKSFEDAEWKIVKDDLDALHKALMDKKVPTEVTETIDQVSKELVKTLQSIATDKNRKEVAKEVREVQDITKSNKVREATGMSQKELLARRGGLYKDYKDDPIPYLGGKKTYRDLQHAVDDLGVLESTEITQLLQSVSRARSKREVHQILKAMGVPIEDLTW